MLKDKWYGKINANKAHTSKEVNMSREGGRVVSMNIVRRNMAIAA